MKKSNQIEYIVKGFSNKRRIDIILILLKKPELSVSEIADNFGISFTAVSNHLLKMMATGIIMKRNDDLGVRHALTEKGKVIASFLIKI